MCFTAAELFEGFPHIMAKMLAENSVIVFIDLGIACFNPILA